ncbi:putative reverse transcriptase, RNA-dependent DNA polymerase [Tanacetum coccineum]
MNQIYEMNEIKREFSVARTPQQNGVDERRNRILGRVCNTPVSTVGPSFTNDDPSSPVIAEASNAFEEHLIERFSPFKNAFTLPPVSNVTPMDDTGIFGNAYDDEDVGAEADLNNLETTLNVSSIPTTRIDKDHPKDQIIRDFNSAIQTRRMTKISDEHAMMDVKSAFLYGTIEEEVYVCQPPSFEDPRFPDKVYKVEKALYGLHQAFKAWSTKKSLCDEFEASRPDITFAVSACARFQVTPKMSHLHVVKRIFRYLKGQPKLGLWYPRDSPFDLEAFSDSDYAGASLDRKSTTGSEYVAAANCCGHVLWIQNQMLDYGFNFMNTKIFIDNEITICIVKNLVFHSKTKHIEIRHHFIRDCYEKKLIQVIKIHTDHNVVDLLTKAFDVSRFNFLIASIGLLNL